jgi:hypothetical protein
VSNKPSEAIAWFIPPHVIPAAIVAAVLARWMYRIFL